MNLIFVSTVQYTPYGGSEELWSRVALRLSQEDRYNISILTRGWNPLPPHLDKLKQSGAHLFSPKGKLVIYPPRYKRLLNRFLPSKHKFRTRHVDDTYNLLDSAKPDLVVFSLGDGNEGAYWMHECIKRKIPYVIINQLTKEANWLAEGENNQFIQEGYTLAKHCFFVSKNNLQLMEMQLGTALSNASVVYNPYKVSIRDVSAYPPVKLTYKLAFVANLMVLHKGQDILFRVMNQNKWKERPLEINLYGKGIHELHLKRLKEQWQLKRIHFWGFVDDIDQIWDTNHGLVLCSRMEGMPIALVEAMLRERVSIVTNVGGNSELVEDNVNGFIAKAATVECVDEALERAWHRRDQWELFGKAAALKAKKEIPLDPVELFVNRLKNFL